MGQIPTENAASGSGLPLIPEALVGQVLCERYRVLQLLGVGTFGPRYVAEHMAQQRQVLLKVVQVGQGSQADMQRLLRDLHAAAAILHPNVVAMLDFGPAPGSSLFVATELLTGEDFSGLLQRERRIAWPRATALVLQLVRGLGAAHALGVLHRELKPASCFVVREADGRETVRLLDLGLPKTTDAGGPNQAKTRAISVSAGYMTPEQGRGEGVDTRTDIYAVGVILFELLTGRAPFVGENFMRVLTQHLMDPVPSPSKLAPDAQIPPALEAIVLRALQKRREDRFQSVNELEQALASLPGSTLPAHEPSPRHTPTGFAPSAPVGFTPMQAPADMMGTNAPTPPRTLFIDAGANPSAGANPNAGAIPGAGANPSAGAIPGAHPSAHPNAAANPGAGLPATGGRAAAYEPPVAKTMFLDTPGSAPFQSSGQPPTGGKATLMIDPPPLLGGDAKSQRSAPAAEFGGGGFPPSSLGPLNGGGGLVGGPAPQPDPAHEGFGMLPGAPLQAGFDTPNVAAQPDPHADLAHALHDDGPSKGTLLAMIMGGIVVALGGGGLAAWLLLGDADDEPKLEKPTVVVTPRAKPIPQVNPVVPQVAPEPEIPRMPEPTPEPVEPAPPRPTPPVERPKPTKAELTPADLDRGLRSAAKGVQTCGQENGALPGMRIKVELTISGESGKITAARALKPHESTPLGRCVASSVKKRGLFPRTEQPTTTVTHEFTF